MKWMYEWNECMNEMNVWMKWMYEWNECMNEMNDIE